MGNNSCAFLDSGLQKRLEDIRRFGKTAMAYSALQSGLEEFRHKDFDGFIAFKRLFNRAYILSNPITKKQDYKKATEIFLREWPAIIVCQAEEDYALVLKDLGFYVTGFGPENTIVLKNFEVTWKIRPNLKRILSRLSNLGLFLEEVTGDLQELKEINSKWLTIKQNKREFQFLARPFTCNEEADVRFFLLKKEARVLGFCSFDPIYQDNRILSYCLQHLRVSPEAPRGAADFLLVKILYLFKGQGYEKISLGLSPLYQRAGPIAKSDFLIELFLKMFASGSNLYRFKTVGEHKDRYHPQKVGTYLAYSKRRDLKGHFGLLRLNGFI